MPCNSCNSMLVLIDDQWKCPFCSQLPILDKDTAVDVFGRVLRYLNDLLKKHLQAFEKNRLILHVLWEREKFARSYFDTYQGFDLTKFMTLNVLIRQLMNETIFRGNLVADERNTAELVEHFTTYVRFADYHILLEGGFYSLSITEPFDSKNLSETELLKNVKIFPNETYLPVLETFENNDILRKKEAQGKIEEYRELAESERARILKRGKVAYTSDQIIEKWYPTLNQLYCGLHRNVKFRETFDLCNFKGFSPQRIMEFVNQFPLINSVFTSSEVGDFLERLQRSFPGRRSKVLEKAFVFGETNSRIFPLFVRLGNLVYISHRTAFVVYLLLHPILYKERFDLETSRRSLEMERREAQENFEKAGFTYSPGLKDNPKKPRLEIDGIATRGATMYVVECKGWDLKPLYDHEWRQKDLERDLRGIVDGVKYERKDGQLKSERKVSLLEKVRFAEENMKIWSFDSESFSEVRGLIVIKASPPIQEYKGVKILPINQIPAL